MVKIKSRMKKKSFYWKRVHVFTMKIKLVSFDFLARSDSIEGGAGPHAKRQSDPPTD
jgi:hypothetical protein